MTNIYKRVILLFIDWFFTISHCSIEMAQGNFSWGDNMNSRLMLTTVHLACLANVPIRTKFFTLCPCENWGESKNWTTRMEGNFHAARMRQNKQVQTGMLATQATVHPYNLIFILSERKVCHTPFTINTSVLPCLLHITTFEEAMGRDVFCF